MNIKDYIKEVPDFPKVGISFKDISPLLADYKAMEEVTESFEKFIGNPDKIVGLDARGFIFGSILAYKMKLPFVMLRKKGKLPGDCEEISYKLEYGENTFEIQKDSIETGDKIAIVDDLLATGGSAKAAIDLIKKVGGKIESLNFVIELEFLKGRELYGDLKVNSLVKY